MSTSAACIVSGRAAPGAALEEVVRAESLSLRNVDLLCGDALTGAAQPKYKVVLTASAAPHTRDGLARAARSLVPGGRVYVYEAASTSQRFDELQSDLLLSGFTTAERLTSVADSTAVLAVAELPQWGLGASAKLSLKRGAAANGNSGAPQAAPGPAAGAKPGVWKLGDEDEDEELVDDDALLTAEEKAAVPAVKPDDCEVGTSGRKACKNCSCGRAEQEAAGVKLTQDMLDNPTSACGSCYLGDAFRCATCPYRGLPAFKPGQKVTLGAGMLAMDV